MSQYYQGKFKPRNPKKYKGDPSNIVYRSSWELKLMDRLDKDPNVIWWASEETVIGYRCPTDRKAHRYFVDFTVRVRQPDGKEKTLLIEVKPKSQTKPPVKTKGKHRRTYINEVMTYGKNTAKWKAAEEYCKDRGWDFIIMTESELGIV